MSLKNKLKNNQLTIGSWIMIGNAMNIEVMALAGFEWLVVDIEHTSIDLQTTENLIRTMQSKNIKALVRVSKNEEVVIKRILDMGADGIIVSNHGGRQIDSAPSGIMMLKPIVEALKREGLYDKIEVFMDGGIRRGTDVFKALAFGAKAVFLGRPVLWGLQVGGKEGILKVFEMISREFRNVMAISGCKTLKDITPDFAHIDYPLREIKF